MEPNPPDSNKEPAAEPLTRRAHTYEDDVSLAMNATDAATVQELLSTAREREATEKEYRTTTTQRRWYSFFSIILVVFAAGACGYAIYHYSQLTVPAEKIYSVGVFPSTTPIVASETDIRQTVQALQADTSLEHDKPLLVPLVTDAQTLSLLSKESLFAFIEARPTEPFAYSIDTIRLGAMNTGESADTFLILSVPDPQIASKEFLIAEPTLLQLFHRPLGIELGDHLAQVGKEFQSTYLYNMPVRILSAPDATTGTDTPVLLYGYATDRIIVITTNPAVLKAVYDTIIRQ